MEGARGAQRRLGSPVQGELAFRLVKQAEKTEGLYRRPVIAFTPNFDNKIKSVRFAAVAASVAPIAAQPPCGACSLCRAIKINNLSWCEAPQAVEHPRETEKPPGTPSGRNSERLQWRMKRGISTAAVRERENSASRSVSGERQRGYQRLDDVWSVYSPFSRGSLTREREGGGCKNFSFTVLRLFFWLQKKRGKLRPAGGNAEKYCGAENESKRYHWSRIQPLSQAYGLPAPLQ